MSNATRNRVRHAVQQIKRIWSEMDYAQQRLFEVRTGISAKR